MNDKVFFDTNILVYAYDRNEPDKQKIAQGLLLSGIENDNAVFSAQVLGEFFNAVTRKIKVPMRSNEAMAIIDIVSANEVVDIDKSLVLEAILMHKKHILSYWDSLIISAAKRSGCQKIYSEDLNHGQAYDDTTVINPFGKAL